MSAAIRPDDLSDILRKQVEKAKAGDVKSAAFVIDQANKMLQGEQRRPVTITQNNFYGDAEPPTTPTKAEPGTSGKIARMARRRATGQPLMNAEDALRINDDEEEKAMRRREQEEEEAREAAI
jgi:hypothetical protein